MRYVSTRGAAPALDFRGATLAGLASDGGLYVPETWPRFSLPEIEAMAGLPYPETAARVLTPFVGDCLSPAELSAMTHAAYVGFAHPATVPLVQLDQDQWLLELFHGPTLAFKDIALQLLGRLFERFLRDDDRPLTVIGATSGDTGSAAIDALAGRSGVALVMLHPQGRVSEVQRRQMTSVLAANIHNIALADASFDDAQALVKAAFADPRLRRKRLAAVNSINWARLAAQVVYYFHAAVRLGAPARRIAFSVPTGNFGDALAGWIASAMGLPTERILVATNSNDIVARALRDGDYSRRGVERTDTPSMDIQVSSNLERLLWDTGGREGAAIAEQMRGFEETGAMRLTDAQRGEARALLSPHRVDAGAMAAAMAWSAHEAGRPIDPHGAVALAAARAADLPRGTPVVTLATAHPAKFPNAVAAATGIRPELPPRLADLMQRPERYAVLPATLDAVVAQVEAVAQ